MFQLYPSLLSFACLILLPLFSSGQCSTTNVNNDMVVNANTTMSGTYNIQGTFRIEPGITVTVGTGCGELVVNATTIEILGNINGNGVGPRGGSGGLGGADADCRGANGARGGAGGQLGFGPGRGGAGGTGSTGGHRQGRCGFSGTCPFCIPDCANGISGGGGGGGGGGGASYGGFGGNGRTGRTGNTMGQNAVLGITINNPEPGGAGGAAGNRGNLYGTDTGPDIAQGSGGAGAGGGGGGYQNGGTGNSGGSGGGMVSLNATFSITVIGDISVNGASGGTGGLGSPPSDTPDYDCTAADYDNCVQCIGLAYCLDASGGGGTGGGGGSGGGIKIQGGGNVVVTGNLSANGGAGGTGGGPSASQGGCYFQASGGAGGGGGRIKIFSLTGPCFAHNIAPGISLVGGTGGGGGSAGIAGSDGVYRSINAGSAPALAAGSIQLSGNGSATCGAVDPALIISTVNASGGNGTISYQWQSSLDSITFGDIVGQTGATFDPPVISNKTFYRRVAISGSCTEASNIVTVDVSSDISVFTIPFKPLCFGTPTGKAVAVISGGVPPYTYDWNTIPPQTTDTAYNLAPGIYFVDVGDASGCSKSAVVVIDDPVQLFATITNTQPSCYGTATGSAMVNGLGGVQPYTYTWSTNPAQTAATATGIAAGAYTVTVTDNNGCTVSVSTTLTDPPQIFSTMGQLSADCAGDPSGLASVLAVGGFPPYTYRWSTNPQQTGANATDLLAGSYTVTITDATGCTASNSIVVEEPLPVQISLESVVDVTCRDGDDGFIDITATGGTPAYTFSWDNGASNEDIGGLQAGAYFVTATDDNGCTASFVQQVAEPFVGLEVKLVIEDASCYGTSDGSVTVDEIIGGTPPYRYQWQNFDTTAELTAIPAGEYAVVVTDSNDCETVAFAEIVEPQEILVEVESDDADNLVYFGYPLELSATIDPPNNYVFAWSPAISLDDSTAETPEATPLENTTYVLEVTDPDGCKATGELEIRVEIPRSYGIPNAFSPNGDGENDQFFTLKQRTFKVVNIQIFDRWGAKMYEGATPWDGTLNGDPVVEGVYIYIIDLVGVIEEREVREIGSVVLLR